MVKRSGPFVRLSRVEEDADLAQEAEGLDDLEEEVG
jgi:hypothetical protein